MKHLKALVGYIVVSGFGIYSLYLYYTGKINFYIHPRYTDFAVLMGWTAVVFGVVFMIRYLETRGNFSDGETHNHEHDHGSADEHGQNRNLTQKLSTFVGSVLIILPLVFGFLLPVRPLSVVTAQQRAVDFNSIRGESAASLFLKNTKTYSLGDWIKAVNNNPDLTRYIDKEVKVSGFVFNQEGKDNEFFVSRFLITCCAVDARPLGLLVNYDWQNEFRENEWVEVEGKFALVNRDGTDTLIIEPSSILRISEPTDPYVF